MQGGQEGDTSRTILQMANINLSNLGNLYLAGKVTHIVNKNHNKKMKKEKTKKKQIQSIISLYTVRLDVVIVLSTLEDQGSSRICSSNNSNNNF